ncbi:MAG: DUF512 domain-containing protein [Bacillota bacterium]|nr:DUF512 domain-containing protein [Bacillota bacterium]
MRDLEAVLRESPLLHGVLPLTSVCNVSCVFCSNLQNPPSVEQYRIEPRPLDEVLEHIHLLRSHERVVIGESATRIIEGEPYTYPHINTVLLEVRRRLPGRAIAVTTNGMLLRPDDVSVLSETGAQLTLSLNALGPRARLELMGDRSPSRVVEAATALARAGVELYGSMVAMPSLGTWSDFRDSVRFLAGCGARAVRVFIPGFTKVKPYSLISAGDEARLFEEAEALADLTGVPVLIEPTALGPDIAHVAGVIRGSPAYDAGFKRGDRVLSIDGARVISSTDAHDALNRSASPTVSMSRSGVVLDLRLTKPAGVHSGVIMKNDMDRKRLVRVLGRLRAHRGRSAIVTSRLAQGFWRAVLEREASGTRAVTCAVFAAENHFYGGNIACAGLLTAEDFQRTMDSQPFKDWGSTLALLPQEPFDPEGRDLLGVKWQEAGTEGCAVEIA